MKRVYVAGPISADNTIDALKNIGRGELYCAQLFIMGYAPFCPFFDKDFIIRHPYGDYPPDKMRALGMAWLEVADCMFVLPDSDDSVGVQAEVERAKELGIPVYTEILTLLADEK